MKESIQKIAAADPRLIIGLMSGTSADGIDAALVEVRGHGADTSWKLLGFASTPFDSEVRNEVLDLQHPSAEQVLPRLARLHYRLGNLYAKACRAVAAIARRKVEDIHLIGCHGQTVFHDTARGDRREAEPPATLQIGEAQILAEGTGIAVVSNFRARDVAVGGTGAPLVPLVDWLLFRSPDQNRLCLNLGGIGNLTSLRAGGEAGEIRAFDTGPANMILDALVTRETGHTDTCDRDGTRAARAEPDAELLAVMMKHPYLALRPPKSCGREEFGAAYVDWLVDEARRRHLSSDTTLSTGTSFTARSVAEAVARYLPTGFVPDEVLVSGGGVHNREMLKRVGTELERAIGRAIPVTTTADHGLDPDAKEALAFALLANESIHGGAGNVPSATGARRAVVLGSFTAP
ncbi:MAG: anhydro-N-acetylmuramic acid kinase [Candidatus Eisenbacteria bacterium]|nr:anhydro-N-acetylmuramic acid kinase [Candidatus Eisenbacteria bacterium]